MTSWLLAAALLSAGTFGEDARPIVIPARHGQTSQLAQSLAEICGELSNASALFSPDLGTNFDPADFEKARATGRSSPGEAAAQATIIAQLKALRATCAALPGAALGTTIAKPEDLKRIVSNLRALGEGYVTVLSALQRGEIDLAAGSPAQVLQRGSPPGRVQSGPAALASLGGLEERLIAGLGDFIVERAKLEAAAYLREILEEGLCEDAENRAFFDNLCVAFHDMDASVSLNAMGKYLQAAAAADLERLPDVALARVAQSQPALAEQVVAVRLALAFYREAGGGRLPLEIARNVYLTEELACETRETARCSHVMTMARLGSMALEALMSEAGWEDFGDDLRPYYAVAVALGIEARYATSLPRDPLGLQHGKAFEAGRLIQIVNAARVIAQELRQVSKETKAIIDREKAHGADSVSVRDRAAVIGSALAAVLSAADRLGEILGIAGAEREVIASARHVATLGQHLASGHYFGVLVETRDVLRRLGTRVCALEASGQGEPAKEESGEGKPGEEEPKKKECSTIALPVAVVRYAPLAIELATAESSTAVTEILEAAAAPAGTYRTKYERGVVAFNAFLGVGAGREWLTEIPGERPAEIVTAMAPVGVHASVPFYDLHVGVMLSVLDLGTLTTARLGDELHETDEGAAKAESTPNTSLEQVFAPGGFLTFGLWGGPFVLSLGAQVAPKAREVLLTTTAADGSSSESRAKATAVRVLAFLAVDVPIFAF